MSIEDDDIIEMTDENGEEYKVRIIDLTAVDGVEYAVLQPLDENGKEYSGDDEDEDEYVLMRLKKDGEEYSFETIDDDAEFERVSEYIDSAADEIED